MCKQRRIATLPGTDGTCHTIVVLTLFGVPKEVEGPLQAALCANLAVMIFSLGLTRRLRRGRWGRGGSTFFRSERKYQRRPAAQHSRGGPPRCALFANIGVPGTAVPGSCICSGLPVANCLRQLCPPGTRSLSAQASVCGAERLDDPNSFGSSNSGLKAGTV